MDGFEKCFGWEWNTVWTAFAAIGTVGAFAGLLAPKLNRWCRKQNKRMTLQKFFKERKPERFPTKTKSECIKLKIVNYIDSSDSYIKGTSFEHKEIIIFFKQSNVFFHDCENLFLNGIQIEKGYNLYKILNNSCIQVEIINDNSGEIKFAYIFKDNNISLHIDIALDNDEGNSYFDSLCDIEYDIYGQPQFDISDDVFNREIIKDDIENIKAFEKIVSWRFE